MRACALSPSSFSLSGILYACKGAHIHILFTGQRERVRGMEREGEKERKREREKERKREREKERKREREKERKREREREVEYVRNCYFYF